ncbi:hypothetical protein AAZX31_20G115100 [Glycine max]|uniref:Bifunctional inhibitor/plant lipid transfer protein/seed storage helical domain-containing protein n=1 Tax=Glycine max TaxID=3847 RepID=K7N355_SOYBN|nr:hypothetical protein JHK85_057108 [Glycine max]KAH1190782.1 hypothetical protein GmHk_20G058232 [Glycine max]KRG91002.1 hypothetical protein GLYMA_20G127000v4 [Glycine max]
MEKNKMKANGVMIMIIIMLDFSQAISKPSLDRIEPNRVYDKLDCLQKCELKCLPLLIAPGLYVVCVKKCYDNICHDKPPINDCIIGCGLIKSIDINIDAREIANLVDSCVQKCRNK